MEQQFPPPRWYAWLFVPFFLPVVVVIGLILGLLALVSIPYFLIYPDHHLHVADVEGPEDARERLARWRAKYRSLGFLGRLRRAQKVNRRLRLSKRRALVKKRVPTNALLGHSLSDRET